MRVTEWQTVAETSRKRYLNKKFAHLSKDMIHIKKHVSYFFYIFDLCLLTSSNLYSQFYTNVLVSEKIWEYSIVTSFSNL